jgi:hypothetical protein
VWVVAEFPGHVDDASTEEKRAARERAFVRKLAGKSVLLQPSKVRDKKLRNARIAR